MQVCANDSSKQTCMFPTQTSSGIMSIFFVFLLCLLMACTETIKINESGETHFLRLCDTECPGDLECLCGFCTHTCDYADECSDLGGTCGETCTQDSSTSICDRSCSSDTDCREISADHRCVKNHCRAPQSSPMRDATSSYADAAANGQDSAMLEERDANEEVTCGPGCRSIVGYRVDETLSCIMTSDASDYDLRTRACVCNSNTFPASTVFCSQRLVDGTAWIFESDQLEDPASWGACTERQETASITSCDFVKCEFPPDTTCSLEDFCQPGRCDSLLYDENGCIRATCESDTQCAPDERCTYIDCISDSFCSYQSEGNCTCNGVASCFFGNKCAPIEMAGPRGEWRNLEVRYIDHLCGDCDRVWRIAADGTFDYSDPEKSESGSIEPYELEELQQSIDGAPFRLAIQNSIQCVQEPTDVGPEFTLELSTQTLVRSMNCSEVEPASNIFQQLYQTMQQMTGITLW